ncbi:MAG: hypothetical protein EOM87_00720 [Clostridia bacterium]|nr:hypothetical protein [Clostridia bacterium]
MKKCLVIINKKSGRASRIREDRITAYLGNDYMLTFDYLEKEIDYDNYDALAIFGGDGTLSTILQKILRKKIDVLYFPYGTVNDRARNSKGSAHHMHTIVGSLNEKAFCYVAACGSFTPIGYKTNIRHKKYFKSLAYFAEALKEFNIHRIKAKISTGDQVFEDAYTLIMLVKSKHCFYFPFNHLYNEDSLNAHLLLIRSPESNGFWGKILLFFSFFRVFFIGLRKNIRGKYITFLPYSRLTVTLEEPYPFCVDGEKYLPEKEFAVKIQQATPMLEIIPRKKLKKK